MRRLYVRLDPQRIGVLCELAVGQGVHPSVFAAQLLARVTDGAMKARGDTPPPPLPAPKPRRRYQHTYSDPDAP